jgi:hypothetical protein
MSTETLFYEIAAVGFVQFSALIGFIIWTVGKIRNLEKDIASFAPRHMSKHSKG